jgi:hypothetical protein
MRSAPSSFAIRRKSTSSRRGRAPAPRRLPAPRGRPSSTPLILRGVAAAILVSGWLAAAVILVHASRTHDADAVAYQVVGNHVYPITLAESKRDTMLVQQMGGDLGVWIAEFDVWFRALLRPPGLAWTLLVLSTAVGAGCLEFAKLSAEDVDE